MTDNKNALKLVGLCMSACIAVGFGFLLAGAGELGIPLSSIGVFVIMFIAMIFLSSSAPIKNFLAAVCFAVFYVIVLSIGIPGL